MSLDCGNVGPLEPIDGEGSLRLVVCGISLAWTAEQAAESDRLFRVAGAVDGEVSGSKGAQFFRRSGLSKLQLREVWRLANGGRSKPSLRRRHFFVALRLIESVQSRGGGEVDEEFMPSLEQLRTSEGTEP